MPTWNPLIVVFGLPRNTVHNGHYEIEPVSVEVVWRRVIVECLHRTDETE